MSDKESRNEDTEQGQELIELIGMLRNSKPTVATRKESDNKEE